MIRSKGENKIRSVLLDNGEVLDADICILGAGVIPATKFLKKGVKLERDGSVVVDKFLQAADHLYAAGDICRFPFHMTGEMIRVEHWGTAEYHGSFFFHRSISLTFLKVPLQP